MEHTIHSDLIYGKNKTGQITSIEVLDGLVKIHKADGSIIADRHDYFLLWERQLSDKHYALRGDQQYKYFTKRDNKRDWINDIKWARKYRHEFHAIWNDVEQYMVKNGVTYYKGMKLEDLKVLSVDIETTTIKHSNQSKILLISNTYQHNGQQKRKLFAYDEYPTEKAMIKAWCDFVCQLDPHVLCGHNLLGFDLPYIEFCYGDDLPIGRNNGSMEIDKRTREFRKDGSQTYKYKNINIPGREIVDTWFLAIKYDVARRYPSYRLKEIIKHDKLEKDNRQYYEASEIAKNYKIPEEWTRIKTYAEHDADDSLCIFYRMCPAYFYYAQSISKPFQEIILGATGSQINNIMTRAYLQQGYSIPKSSNVKRYEGGISFGNPGIYEHVQKVDVASMYPSIILDQELYDRKKDPQGYLLKLTKIFTEERLNNKAKFRETSENYYDDLQQAQKIVINSIYGFLGCPGLSFNSPAIAAKITSEARKHLTNGIKWAEERGFTIVNADTDSFMYTKEVFIDKKAFLGHVKTLNAAFPEQIKWEDDGQYKSVVIVKAKNYAMATYQGNITIKGSGLKGTMKEPALREFMTIVLEHLLRADVKRLPDIYNEYAKEIKNLRDISRWASKKTITDKVLNPERTNERRILDAIKYKLEMGQLIEGDKIKVFFREKERLELEENFNGVYDSDTLYNKLFTTIKIFDNVVSKENFNNYKLKKNKELLEKL